MKVLHVYRTYYPDPPGGLQEAIRQIALSTQSLGVESRVFALSTECLPSEIQLQEGLVIRERSWIAPASCDIGLAAAIRSFSRQVDWADLVHYHFPWPFADILRLLVGEGKPSVMTYHSDIVRQRVLKHVYDPLMHRMLSSMDAIVATSPAYASTSPVLVDPRHAQRVCVVPLGIEESSYPATADNGIFEQIGVNPNFPYFLFVGVLRYYKGLRFLIDAASRVNVPVVIAGDGPEGVVLKAQVRQLGLENVIFTGRISDAQKVALLGRCYAFILPSHLRSEAFGVVLIEAGMYRRPMISCEIGSGTSFANIHGETGLVIEPENADALARAMNILLADKELTDKYGLAARARYESLFSGFALGKAYFEVYQAALGGGL